MAHPGPNREFTIGQPEDYTPPLRGGQGGVYNLITTYDYDTAGRLFRTIDHRGPGARETRTLYDDLGRVWKTIVNYVDGNYSSGDPDADIVTEYQYDANGNLLRTIDTLGRATQTGYDALHRPITVTVNYVDGVFDSLYPDQDVQTVYTYDPVGNQVQISNIQSPWPGQDGQITKYDYDALNRVITVTANYVAPGTSGDSDTNVKTIYTYDAAGNRTGVTDPNQHVTTYYYDELNRVVTTTNHLVDQTVFAYDAVGNRTGVTDARQNRTVYKYDSLYRLAEVRQDYLDGIPEGGPESGDLMTTFAYDPLGNRLRVTDAESRTTTYGYDALNRVVVVTNTLDHTQRYSYDARGDRTAATDENQHTTAFTYDDLGRVIQIQDAEGITTTYTYDGLGNRLSVINGENERTRYGYDDLNRLEVITNALDYETRYEYDALGNRVAMVDAELVRTRYEYDDLNRLVAVTENYAQGQGSDQETNVRTSYGYDAVGNRTVITNARQYTTTYGYDELNRLERVTDAPGHETRYGYDAVGNRTVITDANYLAGQGGAVTSYLYDHVNRLTGIDYPAPGADVTFTYDKVGNRKTMGDGTGTTTYDYDDLYRLESVTDGAGQTVGYSYYPNGNRRTMTYPGSRVITYTYDMANRLDTVTDWDEGVYDYTFDDAHRLAQIVLPGAVPSTYDYDDAGRLITLTHATASDVLAEYVYNLDDVGNRASASETLLVPEPLPGPPAPPDSVTATFTYDSDGNRVAQTINGVTTQLTLDRVGLPEVIATSAGDRYLHLPGLIVTENISGAKRYLLADGLGSIRQAVDNAAAVVTYNAFDPYGVPMQNGGNRYGYTSEWWQGEVSLLYLRARWYDADTGRFITPDPWPGDPLDPSDLFPSYQYASDNPINYTDPTGMWRWWLAHPLYHMPIEDYYEGMLGFNPDRQLEYPIPLTPFRHPDMFNSMLGDVYEIEPWYLQARGAQQVTGYTVDLLNAAQANQLKGSYLGIPYDWNLTPFRVGTGIDWPAKFRRWMGPTFPAVDLVADYAGHGVVIYWIEPNVLSLFGTVPFLVPNKRLVRPPNWVPSPQPVPQPAYAMSVTEACGYTLIVVGGVVIIATLVEDITLVGTIDDIVTVPGGLLLINLGQRLAVFVPAQ